MYQQVLLGFGRWLRNMSQLKSTERNSPKLLMIVLFLTLLGFIIGLFSLDLFPDLSPTAKQVPALPSGDTSYNKSNAEAASKSNSSSSLRPDAASLDVVTEADNSNNMTGDEMKDRETSNSNEPPKPKEVVDIDKWLQKYKDRKKHPNVLFLVADDMRPEIGANVHGQSPWLEPGIVTPSLDSLASKGLLFRRAYCQFSWCNPSRSSLFTSRRPDTTMVHNNSVFFRMRNPDFKTLPQYFKENGFLTLGMGKIYHLMGLGNDHDEPLSWTLPMLRTHSNTFLPENGSAWQAVFPEDRHGKRLLDEVVLAQAKDTLTKVADKKKTKDQPFFIAVGLKKPHFNFQFPEHYIKNYPMQNIHMPANPKASPNLPDIAWFTSFEVRGRKEYKNETDHWNRTMPLPDWIIKDLRRAYYSCITYIDDLIGQLLKHLEDLGLAEDTIVSFIGDHGFHLGEHSIVGKNTAFEVANNSPMIIRVPGVTDNGLVTDKLVEFVDLFPTLADLAGLPKVPYCPEGAESNKVDLCTEGTSLVPLFRDPSTSKWKESVFYQYPHYTGNGQHFCMGYSMRTAKYRYTEWIDYDYDWEVKANWTNVCAAELYDHDVDPHETVNLADDDKLGEVRKDLSAKLQSGWLAALPKHIQSS